jgi:aspartyl-tRNA(Asn)/glutamyl-tRNA(Gln) amidotransferase subunit A
LEAGTRLNDDILLKSIKDIAPRIKSQELSPIRLLEDQLRRIDSLDKAIDAYITLLKDEARKTAEQAEKAIQEDRYTGPLQGIPLGIKDIVMMENVRCTAGSKILSDFVAPKEATIVKQLRNAVAVILGTLNLHEFASGVTNVNPFFGTVHNPWDLDRISGGSSGGSAAAVAAGLAFATIGTDTSGSIRIPAALCGVFGLKPTYGLISKQGVIPLSRSLDHVGIFARSAWDVAAVLDVVAGFDPQDPDSKIPPNRTNYVESVESGTENRTRVGIVRNYFLDYLDPEVKESFFRFVGRLSELGLQVTEIEVEKMDLVYDTWAAIRLGEAAAFHHKWFVSRPNDYGKDVAQRLAKGEAFTAVEYINALENKEKISASLTQAFGKVDLLTIPTTPIVAPKIGEEATQVGGQEFDTYKILTRLTLPFNVAGVPALAMPIGLSSKGLPISAQLVALNYREDLILKAAFEYEIKFGSFKAPLLS